ncbi:MAG: DegT/DnrJ/EryC1/StrS family aminotransferase, partial [Bacilli bacterium]|nr:DegT/DnrJ/EryC1/StrS family aminotransferase [Bacilli bacterium]
SSDLTKAIIPVDIGGVPCDYKRIYEILDRKKHLFEPKNDIQKAIDKVIVVADAAHSFGAKQNDVFIGNIADFSCFSFHAVKNLTTSEGGAVTWKPIPNISDDDIYYQYQLLSLHGQSKDALAKTKIGAWEYDIVGAWYKCNMTDILASLGLAQLRRYSSLLERRKNIISVYDNFFKQYDVDVLKHFYGNNLSSGHLYMLRFSNKT